MTFSAPGVGVDRDRAFRIAGALKASAAKHAWLFEMPEYRYPGNLKPGSREHALYFTYVISVDLRANSERLWRNAREMFEQQPEVFTPDKILSMSDEDLSNILRKLGVRFYRRGASAWKSISRVLIEKYRGDPRLITPEPMGVEEIKKRLRDFVNLRGPVPSNFYIRAMGETGLLKVKNLGDLDIPVDMPVARFSAYTGVLRPLGGDLRRFGEEPLRSVIQRVWKEAASRVSMSPWQLDKAIWNIGSKLCLKKKCELCPVEEAKLCLHQWDVTL